jgi:uncharacterized protein YecT (DUF1311 family)
MKEYTPEEFANLSDDEIKKAWIEQENEGNKDESEDEDDDKKSELEKLVEQTKKINARLDELEKFARQK